MFKLEGRSPVCMGLGRSPRPKDCIYGTFYDPNGLFITCMELSITQMGFYDLYGTFYTPNELSMTKINFLCLYRSFHLPHELYMTQPNLV